MNNKAPPEWQAHTFEGYDEAMRIACAKLVEPIRRDEHLRQELLRDPRSFHKELYGPFVPSGYEEYAGTYRGAQGTSLEHRHSGAPRFIGSGDPIPFVAPQKVSGWMEQYSQLVARNIADAKDARQRCLAATHAFAWFGKIHPFLDGNGHLQRLIFVAVATELGLTTSDEWTVHPRPYDRLLSIALERFIEDAAELGLVSEYLGFLLSPRARF